MIQIQKAQRKRAKLRVGLSGPSGSGKTYSALLIARGLSSSWEKVLLIDSESGRGELYSDLGQYNIISLHAPYTPESYIEAIKAAEDAGMETIIIDSTSHEWDGSGGCLELNEKLAQSKFKGNTWAAWSEVTPRHRRFIDAIILSKCHMITTARSKTDTIQTEDKKVKKVGMKEIQREGFEYELIVNFNLDREGHLAIASKDNTHLFDTRDPFVIGKETGEELLTWSDSGAEIPVDVVGLKSKIMHNLKRLGFGVMLQGPTAGANIADIVLVLTGKDSADEKALEGIVKTLEGYIEPEGAQATYGIALEARTKVEEVLDNATDNEPQ
jgi:hypothetical protein